MKIHYNQDKLLSVLFIVSFLLTSLMDFIEGLDLQGIYYDSIVIISKIRLSLLSIGFLFSCKHLGHKIWLSFAIIMIMLFVLSYSLFPYNSIYVTKTFRSFIPILLMSFFILIIRDFNIFINCLYKLSLLALFITTTCFFILFFYGKAWLIGHGATYMSYSYGILPCVCCFLFLSFKEKKNALLKLCFFISFVSIIIWGCRGAILSVLAYMLIKLIHYCVLSHKILYLTTSIMLSTILSINFLVYSSELDSFLEKFGIHSRMLKKISSKNIYTGRDKIYNRTLEKLNSEPIEIRGINADYSLNGGYVHNLFLEILYDFGGIIGSVISFFIILLALLTLFLYKPNNNNELILYFFSISFIRLLVSHSLFLNFGFWCWLLLILRKCIYSQ